MFQPTLLPMGGLTLLALECLVVIKEGLKAIREELHPATKDLSHQCTFSQRLTFEVVEVIAGTAELHARSTRHVNRYLFT